MAPQGDAMDPLDRSKPIADCEALWLCDLQRRLRAWLAHRANLADAEILADQVLERLVRRYRELVGSPIGARMAFRMAANAWVGLLRWRAGAAAVALGAGYPDPSTAAAPDGGGGTVDVAKARLEQAAHRRVLLHLLTKTEYRVVRLLERGADKKAIAADLGVTERRVGQVFVALAAKGRLAREIVKKKLPAKRSRGKAQPDVPGDAGDSLPKPQAPSPKPQAPSPKPQAPSRPKPQTP